MNGSHLNVAFLLICMVMLSKSDIFVRAFETSISTTTTTTSRTRSTQSSFSYSASSTLGSHSLRIQPMSTTTTSNLVVLQLSSSDNDDDAGMEETEGDTTTKKRRRVQTFVNKLLKLSGTELSIQEIKPGASLPSSSVTNGEVEVPTVVENQQQEGDTNSALSSLVSLTIRQVEEAAELEGKAATAMDTISLAKTTTADAFEEAEADLDETDKTLLSIRNMLEQAEARQQKARKSLAEARIEANAGLLAAEKAAQQAISQAQKVEMMITSILAKGGDDTKMSGTDRALRSSTATDTITVEGERRTGNVEKDDNNLDDTDEDEFASIASLSYEDVDYHLHEMAPPFIDENQCLIPGETMVRVEKAPENSRRIFAGIDIVASVEDVWKILTDYEHLQDVVPNLVVNEVLELYDPPRNSFYNSYDALLQDNPTTAAMSNEERCEKITKTLRGSKLRQVGGAKVVGINFSARTTLEVREWPNGMPDFAQQYDNSSGGKLSRNERAKQGRGVALKRYSFPRPFCISTLPNKCISMQSVENDDGEFRMYQGVWRMQPLVGCAPPGESAMRLTYAVEISPRPYLPVALVENRIATDLCNNLEAIREFVAKQKSTS